MKYDHPGKILFWLQKKPSLHELREAFPEAWAEVDREFAVAATENDKLRLHRMLHPSAPRPGQGRSAKGALSKHDKQLLISCLVKQRMTALMVEGCTLAIATGKTKGKVRFNLFNGWIAQKLLFKRDFETKPVSMFWFNCLWPLIWQKRLLMPLVSSRGIYCFYSRELVDRLLEMIANRSCLEIAAGDGTLTRFLSERGATITATDDYSWQHKVRYREFVIRLDARTALRQYAPAVVICSWPPADNGFEGEVFRTPSVQLYVVIGSQHRFASGNWSVYEKQARFSFEQDHTLSRLVLPPELASAVYVFRRKGRDLQPRAGRAAHQAVAPPR